MFKNKDYLKTEYIDKNKSLSKIAEENGVSSKLVYYYAKKFGLTGIKVRCCTHSIDNSKFIWSDPVFCYLTGLLITDGYFDDKNHRFSLRVSNLGSKEVLEGFKNHFKFTGTVATYKEKDNDFTFRSYKLFEVLREAGIIGSKNTRGFNAEFILSLNEDCIRAFLRGVLDGDGNIHLRIGKKINSATFRIAMKSQELIFSLILTINSLFDFNYYYKLQQGKYPSLEMKTRDSKTFLDFIYTNSGEWKFLDKYNTYCLIG